MIKQNVPSFIHIGYPKSASTYVEEYLKVHPEVSVIRSRVPNVEGNPQNDEHQVLTDPAGVKVRVFINEKIAESVIRPEGAGVPKSIMFTPGAWDNVERQIRLDPLEMARRVKHHHPSSKVLMIIRNQVGWLTSAYRYFMPRMPAGKRAFADFCRSPRGIVYLNAGFYDRTIAAYAEIFGAGNVKVLQYELLKKAPEKFVSNLCQHFGITPMAAAPGAVNESSSINMSLIRQKLPALEGVSPNLKRVLRSAVGLLPNLQSSLLSENEVKLIQAMYAESNRWTDEFIREAQQSATAG